MQGRYSVPMRADKMIRAACSWCVLSLAEAVAVRAVQEGEGERERQDERGRVRVRGRTRGRGGTSGGVRHNRSGTNV